MFDEKSHSLKMDKSIEAFTKELSSLRTGRANAAMLDLVKVDVYGQQMPINQIASITTPEPRMINIQVWDQNNAHSLKMDKSIEAFTKELSSLRTGRANAAMLDLVKVDVYGQQMPINQIASITTPEPRMINIQVWDQNNVQLIDAAIQKSELGLNPQIDGQLIRLPIPELNEERRTELKKLIKSMGEKCKISIRNIRRDANEELKKLLKSKEIGEDEEKSFEKNVQTITDNHIKIVDDKVSSKEKEIMTI